MRYKFIQENSNNFTIGAMCEVLSVSRNGYYDWRNRPISNRAKANQHLLTEITRIFLETKKRYGYRKIHKQLEQEGIAGSKNRIAYLMKQNGLISKVKKKFKATTNSAHSLPLADNLLNRQFRVKEQNTHWVGDISYIWTHEGWLYLATVLDLYSRAIVGWSLQARMTSSLVEDAFLKAIWKRKPGKGLIFHSDRGSQYAGQPFQKLLTHYQAITSMSRKGNCWDNGVPRMTSQKMGSQCYT
ncbi:MAG: transposase [Francisellaceae bacterium]|nr:transposase [Francisellaceae bacterium]